ncbi:MAG: hypothetical protein HY619_07165 [Thaumarchaeota archaeon]|nr:hypothetical protein [Nitrososphaerota archaeon]
MVSPSVKRFKEKKFNRDSRFSIMDDAFRELVELIKQKAVSRLALLVGVRDIRLDSKQDQNRIYVLELAVSNAAGGRGGGFGQRNITRVSCFSLVDGEWSKVVDISDEASLDGFDPPYHATAMPITLEDGSEAMAAGVVDPMLVSEYDERFTASNS